MRVSVRVHFLHALGVVDSRSYIKTATTIG